MKIYRILGLGLMLATLQAQGLTLTEAIQNAEKNSPRVQQASSEREKAYWKTVESRSTYLPTLTGQVNYLPGHKYVFTDIQLPGTTAPLSIPGIVPTTTYGLQAQYGIFDGFASTNRMRSASMFEKAADKEYEWTEFQTQRQVILQFYRALAAKVLKTVAESNLKTLEDHLHEVNLFRKSGLSTNYDVLRVEVQVSEANSEVLNVADNVETATGSLAELLGQDVSPEPEGNLPDLRADLTDKVASEGQRADLTAMREQVDAFRLQSQATARHWVPRVSLVGNYQYYNNRNDKYDDWGKFRDAYELGVNLTWNLFEGFASEAKSRQAVETRVQTEKTLRIAELKARQDVALWKRKYKYFYSVYKARQSNIGKAKESVRLAREGRRAGSRTNTDLLDAETDLYRSQAGSINAQLGLIEALIQLELATGQKLYEFN
jgi:outer membrane protein TolC